MNERAILILIDGMRPDALTSCPEPWVKEFLGKSTYSLNAQTVFPSVTLPCHMSLFHSVTPQRHGVLTNHYTEPVRPVDGIFERADAEDKRCAFFYTWEQLRDLERPGHLAWSQMINLHKNEHADDLAADAAIRYICADTPDLVFLYLGDTDEVGHDYGWMSEEYLTCTANAMRCVRRVRESVPADYNIILLADHGGHERHHGTEMPEDMTIPLVMNGSAFAEGKCFAGGSILDVAPTLGTLVGFKPAREWEGKSLIAVQE